MAIVPIPLLKSYFETGDYPTQSQFNDLIDTLNPANSPQQVYREFTGLSFDSFKILPGTSGSVALFDVQLKKMPLYVYLFNSTPWVATGSTSIQVGVKWFKDTTAVQGLQTISGAATANKWMAMPLPSASTWVEPTFVNCHCRIYIQINSLLGNVNLSALTNGSFNVYFAYAVTPV